MQETTQIQSKPIPSPSSFENEEEFMGRCVSFLVNEGRETEESIAICYNQWQNKDKTMKSFIEEKTKEKKSKYYGVKSTEYSDMVIKDVDTEKRIVTGIFNTYNFVDSDLDVLITGAAKRTIDHKGPQSNATAKIKHLSDHKMDTDHMIGKILVLEERIIQGLPRIYFESKIPETPKGNDHLINYQEGIYDNHSIGFLYKDIGVAERDSEDEDWRERWNKYYPILINKEEVDKWGYFWVVKEIELYEGSVVPFGANELTPYLGSKSKNKDDLQKSLLMRLDVLGKQLSHGNQSDEQMKMFEIQTKQIKQMIVEMNKVVNKDTVLPPSPKDIKGNFNSLDNSIKNFKIY